MLGASRYRRPRMSRQSRGTILLEHAQHPFRAWDFEDLAKILSGVKENAGWSEELRVDESNTDGME